MGSQPTAGRRLWPSYPDNAAEDMAWLRIANHRLNSASVAVGAVRIAARCNELDRMLRTGPVADAVQWRLIPLTQVDRDFVV